MVPGRLQEKNGKYYMVIDLKDDDGKRKNKWISTGLPVRGNKKAADSMLQMERMKYTEALDGESAKVPDKESSNELLFVDYLQKWLESVEPNLERTTFGSYSQIAKTVIIPYFTPKKLTLTGLTPDDIQDFYTDCMKRVKPNTAIHYHTLIHKALSDAAKKKKIPANPAQFVERPKIRKYIGKYYDADELNALFEAIKGNRLELAVLFGAYYGLRRSEVLGLKWDAFDFKNETITIKHTVTKVQINGINEIVAKDRAKNKSSLRTLPLIMPVFEDLLMDAKQQQEYFKKLCGKSYNKDYYGYVLVNELGERMQPDYISQMFPKFLEDKGLKNIRFHDLRHSCASLLLANGVTMKEIQDWLGHSDFNTTANLYSHLEYQSRIKSSHVIANVLHAEHKDAK